jgi:hypothetical protein
MMAANAMQQSDEQVRLEQAAADYNAVLMQMSPRVARAS